MLAGLNLAVRTMMLAALALTGGCFTPKVKNFGFACDPNAVNPCPGGFRCVNGLCDDGSGGAPPQQSGSGDMARGGNGGNGGNGGGGGSDGGGSAADMAMSSPPDLSMPMPPDLAQPPPPPDLAQVNGCAHPICITGSKLKASCDPCVTQICQTDPICCSSTWDSTCVMEVTSVCGQSCP